MSGAERWMQKLGWDFYPTGPNEGQWLLDGGGRFIAHQGDTIWRRHLDLVKELGVAEHV